MEPCHVVSCPSFPGFFMFQVLLLDERLTPLERNDWLAFRALAGHESLLPVCLHRNHLIKVRCL
jgi:hypothetical protein